MEKSTEKVIIPIFVKLISVLSVRQCNNKFIHLKNVLNDYGMRCIRNFYIQPIYYTQRDSRKFFCPASATRSRRIRKLEAAAENELWLFIKISRASIQLTMDAP